MEEIFHLLSTHYKPETGLWVLHALFPLTPWGVSFICFLWWNWGSERSGNSCSQWWMLGLGCNTKSVDYTSRSFHFSTLYRFTALVGVINGISTLRVAATQWSQLVHTHSSLECFLSGIDRGQETLIPCNFDLSPMVKSRQSPTGRLGYWKAPCALTERNKTIVAYQWWFLFFGSWDFVLRKDTFSSGLLTSLLVAINRFMLLADRFNILVF